MKNATSTSAQLIAGFYTDYHRSVYLYIYYRIGNKEEAEDLSQDVFLRLMDCDQLLRADAIKSFIFTITRNLVNDFLRRYYKLQEITAYLCEHEATSTNETESRVIADDLLAHEKQKVALLTPRCREIYSLRRFEEKSTFEISKELNLTYRTVENQFIIGRKEMRKYMRHCL